GLDGGVWAADPNAGRCTIISPLGAVERVIPLHDSPHLAPRPDGSFWKASFIGVRPSLFDARGVRVRALRLPPTLTAPKDAVGDALLAMTGDTLVVAYVDAGRFLIAPPHRMRTATCATSGPSSRGRSRGSARATSSSAEEPCTRTRPGRMRRRLRLRSPSTPE